MGNLCSYMDTLLVTSIYQDGIIPKQDKMSILFSIFPYHNFRHF